MVSMGELSVSVSLCPFLVLTRNPRVISGCQTAESLSREEAWEVPNQGVNVSLMPCFQFVFSSQLCLLPPSLEILSFSRIKPSVVSCCGRGALAFVHLAGSATPHPPRLWYPSPHLAPPFQIKSARALQDWAAACTTTPLSLGYQIPAPRTPSCSVSVAALLAWSLGTSFFSSDAFSILLHLAQSLATCNGLRCVRPPPKLLKS